MEGRPEQDTSPSFDSWLSQLPDAELTRLALAAQQLFIGDVDDQQALTEATELAQRFRTNESLTEEEFVKALFSFSVQLSTEQMVRAGDLTKEGQYTLLPDEPGAVLALTDQGRGKIHPNATDKGDE